MITSTILDETRGKIICGELWGFDAHAEQEQSELSGRANEDATVYVYGLDLFVTVQILEDAPAVLSLGKLCEDHGYSCEWTSGQKPTSH